MNAALFGAGWIVKQATSKRCLGHIYIIHGSNVHFENGTYAWNMMISLFKPLFEPLCTHKKGTEPVFQLLNLLNQHISINH